MHNNADGLSRSYATPAPDTPAADVTALDEAQLGEGHDWVALEAALEAFEADPHVDGDPPLLFVDEGDALFVEEGSAVPKWGPR